MNTVTTINLAGAAFQVEDPGYAALKKYLDDAKAALEGNPDRDEIVLDMERAIADKCRACLSPHKNVVNAEDAARIVAEMGPVNGGAERDAEGGAGGSGAAEGGRKPKRLYRIIEGEWIGGVATGLAAYFDTDVTLIRILIVVLTILTSGGFVLAYFIAWMIIPPAETAEQKARARGEPFNAQEIVDRVKAEYARLEQRAPDWKRQWNSWTRNLEDQHRAHKEWKRARKQQWRQEQRAWREWQRGPSFAGQLLQVLVIAFFLWLAYHRVPVVHDFLDACWALFVRTTNTITQWIASQS
jgi:phage shock protein PspC (stress-responsive transcriptional regulator)